MKEKYTHISAEALRNESVQHHKIDLIRIIALKNTFEENPYPKRHVQTFWILEMRVRIFCSVKSRNTQVLPFFGRKCQVMGSHSK